MRVFCQLLVAVMCLSSCSLQTGGKSAVVATIGDEEIYLHDIDKFVQQDVYEYMCAIYDVRRAALEQIIENRLGVSSDSIDIDSLYNLHCVDIKMQEPISPRVKLDSLQCVVRGNVGSKVCLTIIADYECSSCRSLYADFEAIFSEFSDDIKFEQVYYAGDVSASIRASIAASKQDRFWQMHDMLMKHSLPIDSSIVHSIASDLELDMDGFMHDYENVDSEAVMAHSAYLNRKGIYQTPTVMINHRIFRHPNDMKLLRKEILRAIYSAK